MSMLQNYGVNGRSACRLAALFLSGAFANLALAQNPPSQPDRPVAQTQPAPTTHPTTTTAQKDLPPAKEVIDAAIEAMGGKAAIEAIQSTSIKGSTTSPMIGEVGLEIYSARPAMFLVKQIIPTAEIRVGSDGKIGWTDNPLQGGLQLLDDDQTKQTAEQADMFRMLTILQDRAKELETVDLTDFADHDCYKVKVVSEAGASRFLFFDAKDKLIRGTQLSEETTRGPVVTSVKFGEWKKIGDVNVFTRMEVEAMGMEIVTNLTEIEFNKVDLAIFDVPAEVKDLAEKRRAATQPSATAPSSQPAAHPPTKPSTAPGSPQPPGKPR